MKEKEQDPESSGSVLKQQEMEMLSTTAPLEAPVQALVQKPQTLETGDEKDVKDEDQEPAETKMT